MITITATGRITAATRFLLSDTGQVRSGYLCHQDRSNSRDAAIKNLPPGPYNIGCKSAAPGSVGESSRPCNLEGKICEVVGANLKAVAIRPRITAKERQSLLPRLCLKTGWGQSILCCTFLPGSVSPLALSNGIRALEF